MADVGKNIRKFRTKRHMTQDDLAERLFVSRQTVSNYETGKSNPDLDTGFKHFQRIKIPINRRNAAFFVSNF